MPLSTLIPHICIRVCVCVCLRVNLPFVSKFQIVETTVLLGKQSLVMRPDSYIITKLDLDWSLYQWLRTMNEERKMVTHRARALWAGLCSAGRFLLSDFA